MFRQPPKPKPTILAVPADIDLAHVATRSTRAGRAMEKRFHGASGAKTESEYRRDALKASRQTRCRILGCKAPANSTQLCNGHQKSKVVKRRLGEVREAILGRCNHVYVASGRGWVRCIRPGTQQECYLHRNQPPRTEAP